MVHPLKLAVLFGEHLVHA